MSEVSDSLSFALAAQFIDGRLPCRSYTEDQFEWEIFGKAPAEDAAGVLRQVAGELSVKLRGAEEVRAFMAPAIIRGLEATAVDLERGGSKGAKRIARALSVLEDYIGDDRKFAVARHIAFMAAA